MRCDACDRRWSGSARFCGRCGTPLGPAQRRRPPPPPGSGRDLGRPIAWTAALGAVVVLLVAGPVAIGGDRASPRGAVSTAVNIPSAALERGATDVEAADRAQRPLDCSDHLQRLPRPIRKGGLYTGTLEWHDGRLCSSLSPDGLHGDARPRCAPPDMFACAIP